jgi:hypothetical protein
MDLNHARLPIPPRWQSELQGSGGLQAAVSEDQNKQDQHSHSTTPPHAVKLLNPDAGTTVEQRRFSAA